MATKGEQHREKVEQANRFVAAAAPRVAEDSYRLRYHFMASAYWMNDPNGFSFFNGQYHLFYQHYPYNAASTFSHKHWGHAVSDDLVSWRHLPIAIAPSEEYERDGCWSGCAVDDDGKLTLIYTGHSDNRSPKEVQAIAFSDDGIEFEKYEGNPVIGTPLPEASEDFRDPKVWKHGGVWYMIVGTGKDGIGKVVLYRSPDLRSWTYVGVLAESDGTQGRMWECPDLFTLNGKDVLIISPIGMAGHKNIAIVGNMDYETGKFTQDSVQELDFGPDFYAAATVEDRQGRRIMIAWMDMWKNPMPTVEKDWAGAMTVPRVLSLNPDGAVVTAPLPELSRLRKEAFQFGPATLTNGDPNLFRDLKGDCLEIVAEFRVSAASGRFGLKLRCSEDGTRETVVLVNPGERLVTLNTERSGIGLKAKSSAKYTVNEDGVLKLHLFLDRCSIEIFVNDGEAAITSRIYPLPADLGLQSFFDSGAVGIERLDVWEL